MFLNFLNDEEKSTFLKLAIAVIQADKKIEENEKIYVADYCREMGIAKYDLTEEIKPLELAKKIGENSSDSVKRIFLLELVACATVDGDFAESEQKLILSIAKEFKFDESSLKSCLGLLDEYRVISNKLLTMIKEG